jgi:hypothetical protein
MPKLNQIVAVVSGQKTEAQKTITDAHQRRLKPDLLSGLTRNYRPIKEDGEQLPPEIKRVQTTVSQVVADVRAALATMLDAVYTQDVGNTAAHADVKVGERVILSKVPVTHLLFLEKQATDLETFISNLPTLDPAESWKDDPDTGGYRTEPYDTLKTAKVYKTHVAHPPTEHHPAQVQVYNVDETVGVWTNIKRSGALRAQDRNAALARVRALKDAIRVAREEANSIEVEQKKAGKAVLDFVFGPIGA